MSIAEGYSFCLITEKDLYGVNIFIVRFTDNFGKKSDFILYWL